MPNCQTPMCAANNRRGSDTEPEHMRARWLRGRESMDDRLQQSGSPPQVVAAADGGQPRAAPVTPRQDERELVEALRRGDEDAFIRLMTMYYGAMKRLALMYVPNATVAEDVIQEIWIGVLEGIKRVEGRS